MRAPWPYARTIRSLIYQLCAPFGEKEILQKWYGIPMPGDQATPQLLASGMLALSYQDGLTIRMCPLGSRCRQFKSGFPHPLVDCNANLSK